MKYFLDCGYYAGKSLDYYAPLMDETWKVYAFEPSPNLEFDFSRFPFEVELIKKAVWVEDGEIDFAIGGRDDASHIKSIRPTTDKTIKVPCIDFSKFVSEFEGTIVCSFDAEGAEFPVLEKMLADGTAKKLALLDIEFHHRIIEGKTADDASRLRIALESEGVLVKTKVDI